MKQVGNSNPVVSVVVKITATCLLTACHRQAKPEEITVARILIKKAKLKRRGIFGSYYLFTDLSLDTSAKGRISSVSQFTNISANSRYYTFLNNMTLKMLSISQKSSTFAVRKAENVRWCSVYTHTSSTRYAVEYRNILNFKV